MKTGARSCTPGDDGFLAWPLIVELHARPGCRRARGNASRAWLRSVSRWSNPAPYRFGAIPRRCNFAIGACRRKIEHTSAGPVLERRERNLGFRRRLRSRHDNAHVRRGARSRENARRQWLSQRRISQEMAGDMRARAFEVRGDEMLPLRNEMADQAVVGGIARRLMRRLTAVALRQAAKRVSRTRELVQARPEQADRCVASNDDREQDPPSDPSH